MGGLAAARATVDRAIADVVGPPVGVAVVDHVVQLAAEHFVAAGEAKQAQKGFVAQRHPASVSME